MNTAKKLRVKSMRRNLRVEIGSDPLEGSGFEIEPSEVTLSDDIA